MNSFYQVALLSCVAVSVSVWAAPKPPATKPVIYAASQGTTSGNSAVYGISTTGIAVLVEEIGQPQKMVLDGSGNLLITDIAGDNGDLIWRLPPGGTLEPHYVFTGNSFASPYGIALDPTGTLYVTGSPGDRSYTTSAFSLSAQHQVTSLATVQGTLMGLSLSSQGELFAAGNYFSLNKIYKLGTTGFETIVEGLPDTPWDVKVGKDNALYIAIASTNRIYRWDLSSSTPTLAVFADITRPLSLAFDSAGFLYVGQGNGAVSVVDPLGNVSLIATGFRGDPITGIALQCPASQMPRKVKRCFSVRNPITGP